MNTTSLDFWSFSKLGRELADWHVNYESVAPFELTEEIGKEAPRNGGELYKVTKMRFPRLKKELDRTKIIYNSHVTLSGIPLSAYDYVINGKSAIEWAMERYAVTVDLNSKGQGSGIKNDPNKWSENPRYIVDLIKRIVRVSMETNRIVSELPKLELVGDKTP